MKQGHRCLGSPHHSVKRSASGVRRTWLLDSSASWLSDLGEVAQCSRCWFPPQQTGGVQVPPRVPGRIQRLSVCKARAWPTVVLLIMQRSWFVDNNVNLVLSEKLAKHPGWLETSRLLFGAGQGRSPEGLPEDDAGRTARQSNPGRGRLGPGEQPAVPAEPTAQGTEPPGALRRAKELRLCREGGGVLGRLSDRRSALCHQQKIRWEGRQGGEGQRGL